MPNLQFFSFMGALVYIKIIETCSNGKDVWFGRNKMKVVKIICTIRTTLFLLNYQKKWCEC